MRRTFTFISIFALMISMLALPALAAPTIITDPANQCPGANEGNAPAVPDGYEIFVSNDETENRPQDELNSYVPDEGDVICIKSGQGQDGQTTGMFVVDDSGRTLQEWLFYFGIVDGSGEQGRDVSYWMQYTPPQPPFEPEGDVVVEKDAAGTYDETYLWEIEKTSETTSIELYGPGDSEDIDYDVTVRLQDPPTTGPENINVSGTVTVGITGNAPATVNSVSDPDVDLACKIGDEEVSFEPDGLDLSDHYDEDTGTLDVTLECTFNEDLDDFLDSNTATASVTFRYSEVSSVQDETVTEFDTVDPIVYTPTFYDECVKAEDTLEGFLGYVCANAQAAAEFAEEEGFEEGVFVAPKTFSYTYTAEFGPDVCGILDNTATVYDLLNGELDSDSWSVVVDCFVFEGETATGDGTAWRGTVSGSPNTWFQYSPFESENGITATTYKIVTGRNLTPIGSFEVVEDEICFELDEGWELAGVDDNVKILELDAKPTSYVQPGGFTQKFTEAGSEFCVTVEPTGSWGYAIHLDVGKWVPATF